MNKLTKEQALIARLTNSLQALIENIAYEASTGDISEISEIEDFLNKHRSVLNEAIYFSKQFKAMPENTQNRLYITNPNHIFGIGKAYAFDEVKKILEEAKDEYKLTGLKLASALIDSLTSEFNATQNIKNIKLAISGGLDVNSGSLVLGADGENFYLEVIAE